MKGFMLAIAAAPLAGFCANLLENSGFETGADTADAPGWTAAAAPYRYERGEGRNGTRALFFDVSAGSPYRFPSQVFRPERGKRYRAEVWVRTEGVEGGKGGAIIGIEFSGKGDAWLCGSYSPGLAGTHPEWEKIEVEADVPPEAETACVCLYVAQNATGRAWFDDASLDSSDRPPIGGIVSDCYRDTAAGGTVTFSAAVALSPEEVAARGVSGYFDIPSLFGPPLTVAAAVADGAIRASRSVADMPMGESLVTARLSDGTGRNIALKSIRFVRVAELPERKVSFDSRGRAVVGGRPFFPLGVYVSAADEKTLADFEGTPFNCVLSYAPVSRAQLDACERRGLKLIASLERLHYGFRGCPAEIACRDDETKVVRRVVGEMRDHPALLAWYVNDELGTELYSRLFARQELLKELDPDHPTYMVHYQVDILREFLGIFDIIGTDPYPIAKKGDPPISMAAEWTRLARRAVFGGMPVWQVPQIFDWGAYDAKRKDKTYAPTFEEMRNMTHQCIAEGANGLVFWAHLAVKKMDWRDPFAGRWADISRMAAEVGERIPLLLSGEPEPAVSVSCAKVSARAWRLDGSTHLLVVNTTREPQTAEVRVDGVGTRHFDLGPLAVVWSDFGPSGGGAVQRHAH